MKCHPRKWVIPNLKYSPAIHALLSNAMEAVHRIVMSPRYLLGVAQAPYENIPDHFPDDTVERH